MDAAAVVEKAICKARLSYYVEVIPENHLLGCRDDKSNGKG